MELEDLMAELFPTGNCEVEAVGSESEASPSEEGGGGAPKVEEVGLVCDASDRLCDWPDRVNWFWGIFWAAKRCCRVRSLAVAATCLAGTNACLDHSVCRAGIQTNFGGGNV